MPFLNLGLLRCTVINLPCLPLSPLCYLDLLHFKNPPFSSSGLGATSFSQKPEEGGENATDSTPKKERREEGEEFEQHPSENIFNDSGELDGREEGGKKKREKATATPLPERERERERKGMRTKKTRCELT